MRTIIESNQLARLLRQLKIDYRRFDEAFSDVQRALRSAPETFPQVPATNLHRVKLVPFDGVPSLSIFFTYDKDTVTLHFASIMPDEDEFE
jgi:hypothetical protein